MYSYKVNKKYRCRLSPQIFKIDIKIINRLVMKIGTDVLHNYESDLIL